WQRHGTWLYPSADRRDFVRKMIDASYIDPYVSRNPSAVSTRAANRDRRVQSRYRSTPRTFSRRSRHHHAPGLRRPQRNHALREEGADVEMLRPRQKQVRQERRGRHHRAVRRDHEMHAALAQLAAEMADQSHALGAGEIVGPQVDQRRAYRFPPL